VAFFVILWIAAACDPRSFNERDALLPLDADALPAPAPSSPKSIHA
jgi:hypothetical protein